MPQDLLRVFVDLHRVHGHLTAALEARLAADCSLTLGRFEVLQLIGRQRPCRVTFIADELGITWGGASKLVDRLEAAQLCKRLPDPQDGRSSLIELSSAGQRVLTKATRAVEGELNTQMGGALRDRPLDQFAAALRILHGSVRFQDAESESG